MRTPRAKKLLNRDATKWGGQRPVLACAKRGVRREEGSENFDGKRRKGRHQGSHTLIFKKWGRVRRELEGGAFRPFLKGEEGSGLLRRERERRKHLKESKGQPATVGKRQMLGGEPPRSAKSRGAFRERESPPQLTRAFFEKGELDLSKKRRKYLSKGRKKFFNGGKKSV